MFDRSLNALRVTATTPKTAALRGKAKLEQFFQSSETKAVVLREKISFVLGAANIFLTAMFLSMGAQAMAYWYTLKFVAFISIRAVLYRRKSQHYFLFDFCYFANACLLVYIWLLPHSPTLFSVCFLFANGPLAWAVPLWKNSLVFHSLDKLTSCFIHISPAFVTWAFLWNGNGQAWLRDGGYQVCSFDDAGCSPVAGRTLLIAFGLYCLWQALYLVRVEVIGARKVKERDYMTSKVYMSKKGVLGLIVRRFPALKPYETAVFVGIQLVYTLATCSLTPLWYMHSWLHTTLITVVCLWSAWNGASFYFHLIYFAQKKPDIVAVPNPDSEDKPASE